MDDYTDLKAQMREAIEQNKTMRNKDMALRVLDALENGQWYNCIPISRQQADNILSAKLEYKYAQMAQTSSEAAARASWLSDRMLVEALKRTIMREISEEYSEKETIIFKKAEDYADMAHMGQFRDSGEPYIIHPLEVARILVGMSMDYDAIIAGVLHDVVEDNPSITLEMIGEKFGSGVVPLVDGVTKLTKVSDSKVVISKEQQQAENVRKMLLAMAKDIRVIPIKLADRLHNMRTLEYCNSDKRVRKAKETLEIYAPLAHRLGMGQIKCELEDLSFAQLDPDQYANIAQKLNRLKVERQEFLNNAMAQIETILTNTGIGGSVNGRPKHIYSIYKKLVKQGVAFEDVYDLLAIRVVVKTVAECYTILGMVHSIWRPLPFRIKDYISTPKPNGYKSLHSTLIGDNGIPFEVQIRTMEMHDTAEYGIAAHWKYKEGRGMDSDLDSMLSWFHQLMQDKIEDSGEFLRVLKVDFFSDFVFVYTKDGEVIDLVTGSTPIDFAYRIHSEVGNKCVGATVNSKIVSLDTELKTGDTVKIFTSNSSNGPRRDWLNIVKTQQAKSKIKSWFKKELKVENIERGKHMLELEAKRNSFNLSDMLDDEKVAKMFKRLSISTLEDLYAAVGYGSINTSQVIPRLVEESKKLADELQAKKLLDDMLERELHRKNTAKALRNTVLVRGDPNMVVRFARCCAPVPGDPIVGYITRGRGVSVHRSDCSNVLALKKDEQVRFIDVCWMESASTAHEFTANLQITAYNRSGLVFDVSQLFLSMNISISSFNAKIDKKGNNIMLLEFDVKDAQQLEHIKKQVTKLDGVTEVFRVQV